MQASSLDSTFESRFGLAEGIRDHSWVVGNPEVGPYRYSFRVGRHSPAVRLSLGTGQVSGDRVLMVCLRVTLRTASSPSARLPPSGAAPGSTHLAVERLRNRSWAAHLAQKQDFHLKVAAVVGHSQPRSSPGSVISPPPDLCTQNGLLEVTFMFQTMVDEQGLTRYCYITDTGLESPTLHVYPGDQLIINFQNNLPAVTASQIIQAAYDRTDRDDDAKVASLAPARVPDRTRRAVIAAFAPHHMRGAEVIDADGKQVAKWEEETVGQDVIVSAHGAGELRFRRPGRPAVGGSSVEGIPKKMVLRVHFSRVHPCDADVARSASGDGREAVLHAKRGV